ncbi:Sodium/hydrogen exchanger family-domain-containing protein [Cokeromyces recurvatus]|uniref:Sodium/hydrogen exchanger family-domain-containing protein n=1 Tax=Cokeromyces recurvatus TaxID=90255 RepID=UPI002220D216|nr:Sodium/hydrogen exchanger family-domain-containing protein [Cokeromyces recurvatus]KAI7901629.1 Sodium/hydrogen exchanger family-domain-containing protein [Cokeromyces recurvatus]
MGRIPHFKETIFPTDSLPFLNLIATLGLVFFLFQVGLEVDLRIVKRDWKQSVSIAIAGMALPFGLGAAVSLGLYKLQDDSSVSFSSFVLFLGVAMAITAFPVLARILAELKLLRTRVGVITMSAGLLNDCTAWVLLALVVALLNSSGGLQALYVFLTTVAFALFLIFLIAPLYRKLCVYTNSFEAGPSPLLMVVTLILVLVSAFVTDITGVHPIFGGFLAGVIIPHDNDLAIKITEKFEDFVNIIFLPLYFTLSGLKTQIGLLNTGVVWGYVILVIVLACFGKIIGCAIAAKLTGLDTRESFTIGFLMSCKGLVELIVLNIGHDAGVLNDQVFVIMVVMALITTFMTTPIVMWLYPEWYQKQTAEGFNEDQDSIYFNTHKAGSSMKTNCSEFEPEDYYSLVTMMNRIDTVPSMMALIRLLKQDSSPRTKKFSKSRLDIHVLRLLELTQRASDVMKIQDMRETQRQDPVLNVLRTFTSLIGIESLHTRLDFRSSTEFINAVSRYSESVSADLILLPWIGATTTTTTTTTMTDTINPFEQSASSSHHPLLLSDVDFASSAYSIKHCTVGLFIDRGFGHIQDGNPKDQTNFQIIVPFSQGGPDDRAALLFALRLQLYRQAEVLVLKPIKSDSSVSTLYATPDSIHMTLDSNSHYMTDQDLIETLFVSTSTVSNVVLKSVVVLENELSMMTMTTTTLLDHLERSLGRHDLIVLGRSITVGEIPLMTPATTMTTATARGSGEIPHYSRGFKAALGNMAYQLLSVGTLASLVVIQAPIDDSNNTETV